MTRMYNNKFSSGIAGFLTAVCIASPAFALSPNALPSGGSVTSGSASISTAGNTKTIHQTSGNAIIGWNSFDIGSNATVNFQQPSTSSVTLNRIGGNSASEIYGHLNANGNIILANQNGINFRNGSHVNVGGLIATTSAVSDPDASGKYAFTHGSKPNAKIVNEGNIQTTGTVGSSGLVALVAPNVTNSGTIEATMGKVILASGDTATAVDFYGDGLLSLQASDNITQQDIENNGDIRANGGQVTLTAAVAKNVVDSLINTNGLIEADTIGTHDGKIVLSADKGTVKVFDEIYARGQQTGETGGMVTIEGRDVYLCNCTDIDARGKVRGAGDEGQITIKADTLTAGSSASIRTNKNVTFEPLSKNRSIGVAGASGDLQITSDILEDVDGDKVNGVEQESITIGNTADTGTMKVNAFDWDETVKLYNGTGDIQINGKQTLTRNVAFLADTVSGDIVMGSHGRVVADSSTTGTPITLAASGGAFINHRGSDALSTGNNARWLVYSNNPTDDTFGNLDSHHTAVWGTSYDTSISQTGDRYVFAYRPTVTITLDNLSKTYGTDATAAVANDHYTVSGVEHGVAHAFLADTNATAFSGTPVITSAGSPASANAGGYAIDMTGVSGINGYMFAYVPGTLTVNKAMLTVTADNKSVVYGSTPALTDTITGFVSGQNLATSGVTGSADLSTTPTANLHVAGSPYIIFVSQGSLSSGNYTFNFVNGHLTVTPYTLNVVADNKVKGLGAQVPPLTYTFGQLQNGDTAGSVFDGGLTTTAAWNSMPGNYPINRGTLNIVDSDYTFGTFTPGTLFVGDMSVDGALERGSKNPGKRPVTGTLLSIVNSNPSTGNLANLAPKAGGDHLTYFADLAPAAGGNMGVTPLIQCNEATPCDINQ